MAAPTWRLELPQSNTRAVHATARDLKLEDCLRDTRDRRKLCQRTLTLASARCLERLLFESLLLGNMELEITLCI
jgi:hypothetical protein